MTDREAETGRDVDSAVIDERGERGSSGVREDFDAYVRASGQRLLRLAFLLTGDPHEAEDLLQSAYAKALPHWRRVRDYEDPDAYLRRIMVTTRTSWWRRTRGREVLTAPEDVGVGSGRARAAAGQRDVVSPGWPPSPGPSARSTADDVVVADALLTALRALPRRQLTAVVLRHYCDLSEAEAARVMGVSVGAVKSQTSRGLAALRVVLAARADADEDRPAAVGKGAATQQPEGER